MIKWAKIIAASVLGLVVLTVGAAGVWLWRFDPNDYKDYVAEQFQARSGRSLSIDGKLKLELYPWLAVDAGGISIGNAAGFGPRPFATIQHVSARVKLLPLLRHELQIGTVSVDGMKVNLARDRDGRGNWDDLLSRAAELRATASGRAPASAAAPRPARLAVAGIRIQAASIDWRDDGRLRYALDHVDLDTGPLRPNAPVDLRTSFSVHGGEQLSAEATLKARASLAGDTLELDGASLSGRVSTPRTGERPVDVAATWQTLRFDRAAGKAAVTGLTTRASGIEAAWQLQAAGLYSKPTVGGSVTIRDAELAPVVDRLKISLPRGVDAASLGRFHASAKFELDTASGRVSADSVSVGLLGTRASGAARLDGKRLHATLKVPRFEPGDTFKRIAAAYLPATIDAAALGDLALSGTVDADLGTGTARLSALSAEVLGLRARADVDLRGAAGARTLAGSISVAAFEPRQLARRLGLKPPATADPKALGRAALDTHFRVDASAARLERLTLRLDGSRITGSLGVENFTHPSYRFALQADRLDVDRYLPPRGTGADRAGERKAAGLALPLEALHRYEAAGRLDAGELTVGGLKMRDFAAALTLGGGTAEVTSAKARLYGGEFAGKLSVDAKSSEPKTHLTGKATKLALEPLIEAVAGKASFSGNGDFDVDLAAQGKTVAENVHSAAGRVAFTLRNGVIDGFNVGRSLCQVYNLSQKLAAPPKQPERTAYQLIRGTAKVDHGVASSSDLLARSSFMEVTGGGRTDLIKRSLSYEFEAKLTAPIPIAGCQSMSPLIGDSLPLSLRGALDSPEVQPDFSKILRRRAQQELKKRAVEKLLHHLL